MEIDGNLKKCPFYVWRIPNFYSVTVAETGVFSLEAFPTAGKDFKLVLQLKSAKNIDQIHYELLMDCNVYHVSYHLFTASVHVRDKFGNSHCYQSRTFTPGICPTSSRLRDHPLWSVRRSNLLAKSDILLKENDTLTLICMFEPGSENLENQQLLTEHLPNQQSAEVACFESLSLDLYKYFVKSVEPDIILKCEDVTFPAHRSLLSARSSVFTAMFQSDMAENCNGSVDINDMEPSHLEQFLQYLSSGVLANLSEENAPHLYAAGSKYAVDVLKKRCAKFMMDSITEDNALSLLALADAHSDEDFKRRVVSFITMNEHILKHDNWLTFSADHALLALDVLNAYINR